MTVSTLLMNDLEFIIGYDITTEDHTDMLDDGLIDWMILKVDQAELFTIGSEPIQGAWLQ